MKTAREMLEAEDALAWKLAVGCRGLAAEEGAAKKAAKRVRASALVKALLDGCDISAHPYKKWNGQHWTLALLADLGCPPGDAELAPLMDATYAAWLGEGHQHYIRMIAGRMRRCTSQEGNALFSALRLGFADERADELARRLIAWQWADGGWNCDKRPEAAISSFHETFIPMRALFLYARMTGDRQARSAAEAAAELFLKRRLFRRLRGGTIMHANFVKLYYPAYWHYNILAGLVALGEAGLLDDPRCSEALDRLEASRLEDGGFPAVFSYARPTRPNQTGYSPVTWGGTSKVRMNPFVTADALTVLRQAGRWQAG